MAEREYGILHAGFDEWGTTVATLVEARAMLATDPCGDCVIVRRIPAREASEWVAVPKRGSFPPGSES